MPLSEKQNINLLLRVRVAMAGTALILGLLIVRLWYLQIVKGDYFRNLSENNRIRSVYVQAPRGFIFDRNGVLLAGNRPSFNVELIKEDCPDETAIIAKLEKVLEMEPGSIKLNNPLSKRRRLFEPRLLLKDVSREIVAKVEARKFELPGVIIEATPTREYLHGPVGAHVLGYIREVTRDQLNDPKYAGYQPGDLVGQYGLESTLEEMIRGVRGLKRVEVNAMGTRISEFAFESEQMGNDVHLTIDADMQVAAEQALNGRKGAVVAMNVSTGEVLVLLSMPAFDPNIFTGEVPAEIWKDLISGRPSKLTNRALQSVYPPGSVFKIVSGLAGLSEKVVSQYETVFCPGYYPFAGRRYRCHKAAGHGWVDFNAALIQSCDTYFYSLATKLGIDTINNYAMKLGLGIPTGLSLVQESKGLIPSTDWKKRYFSKTEDQVWYPGETLSVIIGQGATLTSPIQIARMMAAVANGGKLLKPQVVKQVRGGDNNLLQEISPVVLDEPKLNQNILKIIHKALVGVVNDKKGTGGRAKLATFPDILVAGKTGTAQVVKLEARTRHEDFEDHAWFSAYAPADKPEIAIAVLVENGGHGGAAAAPVANAVFTKYFEKTRGIPNAN